MSTASAHPRESGSTAHSGQSPGRIELEECLREAATLPGVDGATCRWLKEKLSAQVFNLVVAGEFKRGKSTVINALLGEALLPAGVVPLTSVVTVIRSGRTAAVHVELRNGERISIEPEALDEYVTERGNPRNAKSVERVVIDHPSPWLANGIRLVDTPGIGSVYEHNTDETHKYLPQADAVLFVASVDQPVSRAELDFLKDIRAYAGKVFCLLNKTDYLRPEELSESLDFSRAAVSEALGAAVPVFPVSARFALEGKRGSDADALARGGFGSLEEALRRFIANEKADTWLRSIMRGLRRLLSQARLALDLESKVLIEPLERLEGNLGAFRQEKATAERARSDYRVLLEADARRLTEEDIGRKLDAFKCGQQAAASRDIESWFAELKGLSSRKLQAALYDRVIAHIRFAFDEWLAHEEAELLRAFDALCARFWTSLQASVDELMRRSSELFAIDFEGIRADAHWTTESDFYYKFWYEPTSLKLLSSSAVLALPKAFAGPLIVKRIKTTAADLIEVQAGRIRHDLDERMKKSVYEAARQMTSQIESTITGIEAAIARGIAWRQRSVEHAADRGEQLMALRQRIASLDARVARALPAGLDD